MKIKIKCDWCGRTFEREQSRTKNKKHLFCSRQCVANYSCKHKNPMNYKDLKNYKNISAHMTNLNKELNPKRMTEATRSKIRKAHIKTRDCKSYKKLYGRHEHRVVAENILGRPLKPGEVVHHIDGNIRNNRPENLHVFKSQAEHAKFHAERKEVMQNGVHTSQISAVRD